MSGRRVVFQKCFKRERRHGTCYWWFNFFKEDWKWEVGLQRSNEKTVLSLGIIKFTFRRRYVTPRWRKNK